MKSTYYIWKYIRREKIDVVIGHTPKGALVAMVASYFALVKNRIYFRHGLMYETSKGVKRKLFKVIEKLTSFFSTVVVCVSPSVLNKSITEGISIPQKLVILNKGTCNGIDAINKFNPNKINFSSLNEVANKYQINLENEFIVGFVGRLAKDKGIQELVQAWVKIRGKYKNIKLLLIGPMDDRDGIDNTLYNQILDDSSIVVTGNISEVSLMYA